MDIFNMPYTVKALTTWNGVSLSDDELITKIKQLYTNHFSTPTFTSDAVVELRRAATADGDLLARGYVIASDGKSLTTTTVWKSKAVYQKYSQHPDMVAYLKTMADDGWSVVITAISL